MGHPFIIRTATVFARNLIVFHTAMIHTLTQAQTAEREQVTGLPATECGYTVVGDCIRLLCRDFRKKGDHFLLATESRPLVLSGLVVLRLTPTQTLRCLRCPDKAHRLLRVHTIFHDYFYCTAAPVAATAGDAAAACCRSSRKTILVFTPQQTRRVDFLYTFHTCLPAAQIFFPVFYLSPILYRAFLSNQPLFSSLLLLLRLALANSSLFSFPNRVFQLKSAVARQNAL